MAKLTDKTVYSGTLDDADVVHVVDVSDTTQDPAGSSYKLTLIYFYTWILSKLSSVFEPKITAGLISDFWIGNKTWANIRSTVYAQLLAGGYAPTAGTVTNGDSLTQVIQKLDGNDALKELLANKSNSYTVSSTTTYANTKALVDGLATKGVGTILGTVGTTATFGTPIPYGSGTANTVTSSPFIASYNLGASTYNVLANTSTTSQQGYLFEENGSYSGIRRYGSSFTATFIAGTSFPLSNIVQIQAGNNSQQPIVFLGSPIIHGIGQTSTNVATRHDATGWRQGTMADIHTANTVAFEVSGIAKFGSVITLKNYTVATLPTGVRGYECYVTDAVAPTYRGVVVGGGAVVAKVFFDGTNWLT